MLCMALNSKEATSDSTLSLCNQCTNAERARSQRNDHLRTLLKKKGIGKLLTWISDITCTVLDYLLWKTQTGICPQHIQLAGGVWQRWHVVIQQGKVYYYY